MDTEKIIGYAKLIQKRVESQSQTVKGVKAEVMDFLFTHAGPKSSFYKLASETVGPRMKIDLISIVDSFISYVEAGLHSEISIERKVQLDVVSDFLDQANSLLETKAVHPAAPALLIGATLEEFLRTWIEDEGINLGNKKPSIDAFSKSLRENEIITKQDVKDITSWAGIRNHAAHGEWDDVSDKKRIKLMLEGVNLFMRKYSE